MANYDITVDGLKSKDDFRFGDCYSHSISGDMLIVYQDRSDRQFITYIPRSLIRRINIVEWKKPKEA